MSGKLYALIVGIDEYDGGVPALSGCVNDAEAMEALLKSMFASKADIQTLTNKNATYANIMEMMRKHLTKAGKDDQVLFHYSGHGAQSIANKDFLEFFPDGFDEGLVCHDSRVSGNFDLADKELALLISEVAKKDPQITFILDSCHSGSGTRGLADMNTLRPRFTTGTTTPRPLETYAGGWYAKRKKAGDSIIPPMSKHLLMAACDRKQKAQETENTPTPHGAFTATLLKLLEPSKGHITYGDLFLQARSEVRNFARDQDPQIEAFSGFDAFSGFLGQSANRSARPAEIGFERGKPFVRMGAVDGFTADQDNPITMDIFEKGKSRAVASAAVSEVGASESMLSKADGGKLVLDNHKQYEAKLTSPPASPTLMHCSDVSLRKKISKQLQESCNVLLVDDAVGIRYGIAMEDGNLVLNDLETKSLVTGVSKADKPGISRFISFINHVLRWERVLKLENKQTEFKKDDLAVRFVEEIPGSSPHTHKSPDLTLDFEEDAESTDTISGKIQIRNATGKALNVALFYLSEEFGVMPVVNIEIVSSNNWVTLLDKDRCFFNLDEGQDENFNRFRVLFSTERVDDILLKQDNLEFIGRIAPSTRGGFGTTPPAPKRSKKRDWDTRLLSVRLVRQKSEIGNREVKVGDGKIKIKPHGSVKAKVAVASVPTATRGVEPTGMDKALQGFGFEPMRIGVKTRSAGQQVLEINDIEGDVSTENPLQLEITEKLEKNQQLMPLVFDGHHYHIAGATRKVDGDTTEITISEIPEVKDNRRSLGRALKMYFFKTVLGQKNQNMLREVSPGKEGKFDYDKDTAGIARRVANSKRVLVMVHGIIGNTTGIAEGVFKIKPDGKKTIAEHFDRVLAFDYENLDTDIKDTAEDLKAKLKLVGLDENDDKEVTLLVHSMGGLVSRWFVERVGGDAVVDHLVMCGTPNFGSPFGDVGSAIQVFSSLTNVALNYFPPLAAVAGKILNVFSHAAAITKTLTQMDDKSQFIQDLNTSDQPKTRYTIIAGDIRNYDEPSDAFFAKLVSSAGKGKLMSKVYKDAGNDIAVSVDSIRGVPQARQNVQRQTVSCHHMNYFISEDGTKALAGVKW